MPELLETDRPRPPRAGDRAATGSAAGSAPARPPALPPAGIGTGDDRAVRAELRRQIARLEREIGELFGSTFPRKGIEWTVGAAGGPRVLGIAELERVRDRLADRIAEARSEVARRADAEEQCRALVERMIADPAEHRWVRVSNEDVGEPGCKHWHSRPRWGIVGMFAGWWRVKLSSGCPLATGRGPVPPAPSSPSASGIEEQQATAQAPSGVGRTSARRRAERDAGIGSGATGGIRAFAPAPRARPSCPPGQHRRRAPARSLGLVPADRADRPRRHRDADPRLRRLRG